MENFKCVFRRGLWVVLGVLVGVCIIYAQSGGAAGGIAAADTEVRGMFSSTSSFILGLGAVVGLIGGVRCYIKWNVGDQDVMKSVMGWGGACLFLVIVAFVLSAMFGV